MFTPKSFQYCVTLLAPVALLSLITTGQALAGGGYFSLGYGHVGKQTGGAVTALAGDAYAGASNPAKLTTAGDQLELGIEFFNPHRKVERTGTTGPAQIYNFSSTSENSLFLIPDFAYSDQVNDDIAVGIVLYANGGLNSEYKTTTGIAGSNTNPAECGDKPGNFLLGCDEVGFDLTQVIVAPTVAWEFAPGHSLGISPLIAAQRFEAFGFQGFTALSNYPDKLTNNGHELAFGGGVRVGWYGEIKPWLSLGAAYASKIYMQKFEEYKGLLAGGSLDVPANYSIGAALRPNAAWTMALDIQRIDYGEVNALANSVLTSLTPGGPPIGSKSGSAFGWKHNQTNYRVGLTYLASRRLTLRAGYAYGKRPNEEDLDATSLSVLTPNAIHQASLGLSWQTSTGNELHLGFAHFFKDTYRGPSAIFPGARESLKPYVNALHVAWTAHY